MTSQPVRNDINPECILPENYFVAHKIHWFAIVRSARKTVAIVPVNSFHNIYSGWSNTVGINHPVNPLFHKKATAIRRSFHTRVPARNACRHMFFVKFIYPFHVIRLEEWMISFIVAFENTVIPTTILVKFFCCNSLKVFNGTSNSHLVGFEFGDIDQEGVRSCHRGHKKGRHILLNRNPMVPFPLLLSEIPR